MRQFVIKYLWFQYGSNVEEENIGKHLKFQIPLRQIPPQPGHLPQLNSCTFCEVRKA